jgi:hypothetical protein
MRKYYLTYFLICFIGFFVYSQTEMKTHKGGHIFDIDLPIYMSKTGGLNTAAAIQYKSVVKDVYGFVIYDTKEELRLVEMNFLSVKEFYDEFMKDFLKGEKNLKISKPKATTKGEIQFLESDVTYYDKDAEMEIYYLVGVAETKNAFYKVISWSSAETKDQFKTDFQQILFSLKD